MRHCIDRIIRSLQNITEIQYQRKFDTIMEYKGYHADVKYSDEDKLFIGEVIGLNDTLAFHGSSVSELEAMFRQSVDNYLEMCQEFGKKPETVKRFDVRIPRFNQETEAAMKEAEVIASERIESKSYHSAEELFAELDEE